MSNPFDSAWTLLKGINHDEKINWNQAVHTENQIGPNGVVKQERGFGLSHIINHIPDKEKGGGEIGFTKDRWKKKPAIKQNRRFRRKKKGKKRGMEMR